MTEEEKKYNCEKCEYSTDIQRYYTIHKKSKKHKKNYEKEIIEEMIRNKDMKYQCIDCEYYTENPKGLTQHKRTQKHKNCVNNKKELENRSGLIYLIKLSTYNKDKKGELKEIYKFGYSKKDNLSRLKGYKGGNKLGTNLLSKSVVKPKKCENYIKKNMEYNKNYEKCLTNSGEFFMWYGSIKELKEYMEMILLSYNEKQRSYLTISEYQNNKIDFE